MARRRYVPKTYNNRRGLRILVGAIITLALSIVILFLILYFVFSSYVVDGKLEIPWLSDEPPIATQSNSEAPQGDLIED